MLNHTQMKEALIASRAVIPQDYLRSIGRHGWSDFNYNTVKKIASDDSKYIITSTYDSGPDENADILVCPNLKELVGLIEERFITHKEAGLFDTERNRVFCYFEERGLLRIGTKQSNSLTLELVRADWDSLLYQEVYVPEELTHSRLQWNLVRLGVALGLDVKIAINDKKNLNNTYSLPQQALLTINDLNLSEAISHFSRRKIDRIDVIWFDKKEGKIFSAFEVELGAKWNDAMYRLDILKRNYGSIIPIIVGTAHDFRNLKPYFQHGWKEKFENDELKYLTVKGLADSLKQIDNKELDLRNFFTGFVLKQYDLYH